MGQYSRTNYQTPSVADESALSDIWVAEQEDGALVWVQDQLAYYALNHSSGAAPAAGSIVAPRAGAPIAGFPGARWAKQAGSVFSTLFAELATDVVATNAAPVTTALINAFSVPSSGLRQTFEADIACEFDRAGTCAFYILVDGLQYAGGELQMPAAGPSAIHIQARAALSTGAVHSASIHILPAGAVQVSVPALSNPRLRHANLLVIQSQ